MCTNTEYYEVMRKKNTISFSKWMNCNQSSSAVEEHLLGNSMCTKFKIRAKASVALEVGLLAALEDVMGRKGLRVTFSKVPVSLAEPKPLFWPQALPRASTSPPSSALHVFLCASDPEGQRGPRETGERRDRSPRTDSILTGAQRRVGAS